MGISPWGWGCENGSKPTLKARIAGEPNQCTRAYRPKLRGASVYGNFAGGPAAKACSVRQAFGVQWQIGGSEPEGLTPLGA